MAPQVVLKTTVTLNGQWFDAITLLHFCLQDFSFMIYKIMTYDMKDETGRAYREMVLPAGTFRQYEDTPFVWKQTTGKCLFERIYEAFEAGEIKKIN